MRLYHRIGVVSAQDTLCILALVCVACQPRKYQLLLFGTEIGGHLINDDMKQLDAVVST